MAHLYQRCVSTATAVWTAQETYDVIFPSPMQNMPSSGYVVGVMGKKDGVYGCSQEFSIVREEVPPTNEYLLNNTLPEVVTGHFTILKFCTTTCARAPMLAVYHHPGSARPFFCAFCRCLLGVATTALTILRVASSFYHKTTLNSVITLFLATNQVNVTIYGKYWCGFPASVAMPGPGSRRTAGMRFIEKSTSS